MVLLDGIVRSAERLCEGELCCLGHRRRVIALHLLYKVYHRVDHLMNEHLNHFVAARNSSRASVALDELTLAIPRLCCRTDQFSLVVSAAIAFGCDTLCHHLLQSHMGQKAAKIIFKSSTQLIYKGVLADSQRFSLPA